MKNNFQSAANHNKIIPPFNVFLGKFGKHDCFTEGLHIRKLEKLNG